MSPEELSLPQCVLKLKAAQTITLNRKTLMQSEKQVYSPVCALKSLLTGFTKLYTDTELHFVSEDNQSSNLLEKLVLLISLLLSCIQLTVFNSF